MQTIDAPTAARLKDQGALMIDVREPGEYARARIPGSTNIALSGFEVASLPLGPRQAVVFFCASGARTSTYAGRLSAKAGRADAYIMAGGISAWGRAGLPVESGNRSGSGGGFFSRLLG